MKKDAEVIRYMKERSKGTSSLTTFNRKLDTSAST